MKEIITGVFATLFIISSAGAQVSLNFKEMSPIENKIEVVHIAISDLQKSRAERKELTIIDTLAVTSPTLTFDVARVPSQYIVEISPSASIGFFTAPGERISIDINSIDPLNYTLRGTELVEGIQAINDKTFPIRDRIMELRSEENADKDLLNSLYESYRKVFTDFITSNPESSAAPYAVLNLDPEDMGKAYMSLTDAARSSIVMPLVDAQYEHAMKSIEQSRKLDAFQSGDVEAPSFSLKDLEDKNIRLSDYRGKWVILDFWGTWCPWCIKGFHDLKEAYVKYAGKLEIIGIDCGDSQDVWRAGVKRFDLPWVQVYKPEDETKILTDYYVQHYPTKVIISPEGKVLNLTVGENPEFFTTLNSLLGE
ncbi:MAG: TlpA family protein disulfide reductase [Duncaniella sp.]|nr:TlpA family protein disulfide reductase [Duncaniella sp.]